MQGGGDYPHVEKAVVSHGARGRNAPGVGRRPPAPKIHNTLSCYLSIV